MKIEYEKNAKAIYEKSFSIVHNEADLERFNEQETIIAARIAHACGMPDITKQLQFTSSAVSDCIAAILRGAPIICDCNMVKVGVSMIDDFPKNKLLCFLNYPEVKTIAKTRNTTRSAAQCELWHK